MFTRTHVCPGRKTGPYWWQHPFIYINALHWKIEKIRSIHRQTICPVIKNPVSNYSKLITMVINHSYRFVSRCHCGIFFFPSLKKLLKEICQGQRFLLVVVLPAQQPSGVVEPEEMNRQPPKNICFWLPLWRAWCQWQGWKGHGFSELPLTQFFCGEKSHVEPNNAFL